MKIAELGLGTENILQDFGGNGVCKDIGIEVLLIDGWHLGNIARV